MLFGTGIAFFLGIVCVQQFPALPSPAWLGLSPLLIALGWRFPIWRMPCAFGVGLLWALGFAHLRLSQALPSELVGKDIHVEGYIASIPARQQRSVRFEFEIVRQFASASGEILAADTPALPLPFKTRINWYFHDDQPPALKAGDLRRFTVRLKPPNGFLNPGGFDYEGWLFRNGIRATGYVRKELSPASGEPQRFFGDTPWRVQIDRWRHELLGKIEAATPTVEHRGIIAALVLGHRAEMSAEQWQLLLDTGTNHLVAISGLHISLIAGLVYWLVMRLGGYWGVGRHAWPRQRTAALIAFAAGFVYALLAGFLVPTRRALIMLAVGLSAVFIYRQLRPGYALLLALVLVALLDPFAVVDPSFWLSYGAVAVLIYMIVSSHRPVTGDTTGFSRFAGDMVQRGWWWTRLQGFLLLGILPITVFWFSRITVAALFANLLAIPLVGFLVVSLVLVATAVALVSAGLAAPLFQVADVLLELFWQWLRLTAAMPFNLWFIPAPPLWALLAALVGVALMLAPRGLPGRWTGVLWLLPMLLAKTPTPAAGEFRLSALDVGQGTAVVVQTQRHTLVYDTGPMFSESFDTGQAVLIPYLRASGVKRVDILLVSHGDNDHIGGAASLLDTIDTARVLSSVPERFEAGRAEYCQAGQQWTWDGVSFEILHPDPDGPRRLIHGNNGSCVLRVDAANGSALLTGDIEKLAEWYLLRAGQLTPVDLLFAPHHGSRTSSTPGFVDALQAAHVVVQAGYLNRWGFPRPDIRERYEKAGADIRITGLEGMLVYETDMSGLRLRQAYRRDKGRYWHHRPD